MTEDRRHHPTEFEKFVREQFQQGHARMDSLAEDVARNTRVTLDTKERVEQIAKDTESWVTLDRGARETVRGLRLGAEKVEKIRRAVSPWLWFGLLCSGIWAGITHADWTIFKALFK